MNIFLFETNKYNVLFLKFYYCIIVWLNNDDRLCTSLYLHFCLEFCACKFPLVCLKECSKECSSFIQGKWIDWVSSNSASHIHALQTFIPGGCQIQYQSLT